MSDGARWTDRINPVLVKEVRQSLRGRYFRSAFLGLLLIAAVVSVVVLSNLDVDSPRQLAASGATFFGSLMVVFVFSAFVVVPQHAMRSMLLERDARTLDALVTSGLSPSQIVLGKWLASGLLLMLFLSAMLPFLSVGTTLYGLQLLIAAVMLLTAIVLSLGLSLLGIMVATVAVNRTASAMLQGLFSVATFAVLGIWLSVGIQSLFDAGTGVATASAFWKLVGIVISSSLMLYFWLYGLAVAMLTHAEENRLLRLRVACCSCAVFLSALGFLAPGLGGSFDPDLLAMTLFLSIIAISVLNVPLVTESTRLGVRCRHELRQGGWQRPLAWLFLPGGGTGFALYLLQLAVVILPVLRLAFWNAASVTTVTSPDSAPLGFFEKFAHVDGLPGTFVLLAVCIACMSLPGWLAARAPASAKLRSAVRVTIPVLPFVLTILAGVIGLLSGSNQDGFSSPLSPLWAISSNFEAIREPDTLSLWVILAGFGTLIMMLTLANQFGDFRTERGLRSADPVAERVAPEATGPAPEPAPADAGRPADADEPPGDNEEDREEAPR